MRRKRVACLGSAVLAAAALLFFSGCATAPAGPAAAGGSLSAHRVFVESHAYLPAAVLARQLRGQEQWDREAQVWHLTVAGHELRAAAQMSVALLDGNAYELPAAPVMDPGGRLLLPEQLWTDRLARWSYPQRIPSLVSPRRLRTVVIDAGHGGQDPGAVGPTGLREKHVALGIARRLRDLLVQSGFQVVMTRYDDRFIPLAGRSAIANREEGQLFVSIHANSSRRRSVSGFETYYLSEATDDSARALEASENASLPAELGEAAAGVPSETQAIVWDLLYTEHRAESQDLGYDICRGLARSGIPWKNRGVKSARFAVLKGARMPAVLVEVGFISHPGEESRLRRPEVQQRLAEGLLEGILRTRDRIEREYAYVR